MPKKTQKKVGASASRLLRFDAAEASTSHGGTREREREGEEKEADGGGTVSRGTVSRPKFRSVRGTITPRKIDKLLADLDDADF